MENQELNLFSLRIDGTSKANIKSTITWVTVMIVCSIVSLVVSIYGLVKPPEKIVFSEAETYTAPTRGESISSVVIGLIIGVVLIIFLYNFIRYAKQGIEKSNVSDISKGFLNLKNYFLIVGVIFIIVVLLLLLSLLFVGAMSNR
jgi:hypothetical protein